MGNLENRRITNVDIEFRAAGDKKNIAVTATVLLREGEMVIDIQDQPSSGPYLVNGKKVEYFFAGTDSHRHEVQVNVVAR